MGQESDIKIRFFRSGKKIIQTFGSFDTIIKVYSSNNVLINDVSGTDNLGYNNNAFVTFDSLADEEYTVKVSFKSFLSFGYVRMIVNNAGRLVHPGNTSIQSFDDIWHISGTDSYTLYSYCERYKSQLVKYTPVTSGSHTFALNSLFDNYLYVFDPASSSLGVSGIDFDDNNGGGTNASITRSLTAGHTYLIVFSQTNPNSQFTDLDTGDDISITISMPS